MIIILDGCPSAGKTSIIKELQNLYLKPLLSLGIDRFWAMIPEQYKEFGPKAHEGYLFVQSHDEHNMPIVSIKRGPIAEQIDRTMPHVIRSLADSNHDVVADVIFVNGSMLCDYVKELKNNTVYFVGIVCSLQELEKREKQRGNRILGLARGHINEVCKNREYYDLIVDTTNLNAVACAQNILHFIQNNPAPMGFKKFYHPCSE